VQGTGPIGLGSSATITIQSSGSQPFAVFGSIDSIGEQRFIAGGKAVGVAI